jgi:hypothetical protein
MELTKEHFDQQISKLATKEDVRQGVEELARITSAGFARTEERFEEIGKRFDVAAQLKSFERKFQKLEDALHIKL